MGYVLEMSGKGMKCLGSLLIRLIDLLSHGQLITIGCLYSNIIRLLLFTLQSYVINLNTKFVINKENYISKEGILPSKVAIFIYSHW